MSRVYDNQIMFADLDGIWYYKLKGRWLCHGSNFSKKDHREYVVRDDDQDLYDRLEAVKTTRREYDDNGS